MTVGVVIDDDVGMRMKVGEWISSWLCNEVGVHFESSDSQNSSLDDFKLVLAEPLPSHGKHSHVQRFLDDHEGPGLQHLGLSTKSDIAAVVLEMTDRGAKFRKPPPTYYKLVSLRSCRICFSITISIFSEIKATRNRIHTKLRSEIV